MTGCKFVSDAEFRYGKALGIYEYLTKPIQPEELILVTSNVIREHNHH